jgi:hypothetical protein
MATPRNPGGRATVPGRATHQHRLEGAILALSKNNGAGGAPRFLARRSLPSVGSCPYRRSVVMERRKRAERSLPAFSSEITLHNYGPGSRATQRPRCFRPALEPIEAGIDWAGTGAHERRRRLENGHEPAASFRGRPARLPRYGTSFQGSLSRNRRSGRDLRSPWSGLLCITTELL